MTADEMFENLGYKKNDDDWGTEYKNLDVFCIYFDYEDKDISISFNGSGGYINIEELKAINKKCEELDWGD